MLVGELRGKVGVAPGTTTIRFGLGAVGAVDQDRASPLHRGIAFAAGSEALALEHPVEDLGVGRIGQAGQEKHYHEEMTP